MPRRHAARILMVAALLLMILFVGFPAGRGLGAGSHAGQPTLGEVQQRLDQCRSRLAEINTALQTTVNLLKQAKSGARVMVALPDAVESMPVDIKDWQALITLDLFEGKISPAGYAKLQAAIKQWQAHTVDTLNSIVQAGVAEEQGTQQKCAVLERQRNQLLGGTLFKLAPGLTKVVNTHATEMTIDPTADTGHDKHCCDGGSWDVTYTWKVPDTVAPGTKYQVAVGIQVHNVNPEQQLGFQIAVLAPDFAQSYSIEYPHPAGGSTTFDIPVASDQSGSREYAITIGFNSSTVTYTYRP